MLTRSIGESGKLVMHIFGSTIDSRVIYKTLTRTYSPIRTFKLGYPLPIGLSKIRGLVHISTSPLTLSFK